MSHGDTRRENSFGWIKRYRLQQSKNCIKKLRYSIYKSVFASKFYILSIQVFEFFQVKCNNSIILAIQKFAHKAAEVPKNLSGFDLMVTARYELIIIDIH
eukprot:NODE_259_length_12613_cov_0.311411.p7 type:complete len:100 gc:universal NODE_259_length_12613_cov_0.311411:1536-1237(-)